MSTKYSIIGDRLPNIPWEVKPEGHWDVVWRSEKNPIIKRYQIPSSNSIFNSAVIPYENEFVGIFRCDSRVGIQALHFGKSKDAFKWDIDNEPIKIVDVFTGEEKPAKGYDPRVCRIEDRYFITWCNWYHGPTIGVAYTFDFKKYYQCENAFLPYNRNGVMFPRKINGKYCMLSRPSDNKHTNFGDIFYSESTDLEYWGHHRHVMAPAEGWSGMKIGAGPVPIETSEGWLLIFHGVICTCSGYVYKAGAALLDINEPWKVAGRAKPYIMAPVELYECVGDVPNVVFPCAALCDSETGRLAIYYGAADTVVGLAYANADEIIDFIKDNPV